MSLSWLRRAAGSSFLALTLLGAAQPTLAQENPTTPGAIPDPSTYQGSMEQQRQSDAQDQQFRQQMEQQQQEQQQQYQQNQPQQSQPAYRGNSRIASRQSSSAAPVRVDPKTDTPAKAIKRGDYATAHRLAQPKAAAGDAYAQQALAFLYETGSGVPLNYAIAASWNRKAANQGYAPAQSDLGWMYFKGLGVQRDPVQAYKWLALAGRQDAKARSRMQEVSAAISYDEMSQGLSLAQQWTPSR